MIKRYIVDEDLILKDYLKKIGIFSNIQKEIKKFQKVLKICALAILFTMKSVKNIL